MAFAVICYKPTTFTNSSFTTSQPDYSVHLYTICTTSALTQSATYSLAINKVHTWHTTWPKDRETTNPSNSLF